MPIVEIKGFDTLRSRLMALANMAGIGPVLHQEGKVIADAAKARLTKHLGAGDLSRSVEIVDESQGPNPRVAIGTPEPAGWHLEFGTARRRAEPWLGPAFREALPAINHALRKLVAGAVKALDRT